MRLIINRLTVMELRRMMRRICGAMSVMPVLAVMLTCTMAAEAAVSRTVQEPSAADDAAATDGKDAREIKESPLPDGEPRYTALTEEDYREVADSLGVEVAAIKAVVDIEAGKAHKGFWTDGKPLINFDLAMFRRSARRNGINLSRYTKSHAVVFARPNARKYGSQQAGQQARLDAARTIDNRSAIEGTFWGMFQIGGSSWKQCGAESIDDFVERMSRSERDQLEMFANFVRSYGMVEYIRNKDWAAFARRYNGPGYKARGYHTRLAAAYRRHAAE